MIGGEEIQPTPTLACRWSQVGRKWLVSGVAAGRPYPHGASPVVSGSGTAPAGGIAVTVGPAAAAGRAAAADRASVTRAAAMRWRRMRIRDSRARLEEQRGARARRGDAAVDARILDRG